MSFKLFGARASIAKILSEFRGRDLTQAFISDFR